MKDVDTLKGLHGLKTMAASKRRSIPNAQSSAYLDLYMMDKEKDRLDKERLRLEMRYEQIKSRLQEIALIREQTHRNAVKADHNIIQDEPEGTDKGKDWKKMSMNY